MLAISGVENTAVGISVCSIMRGLLPNSVSAKACPSRMATGVSAARSVTSPTAKMLSTDDFEYSLTTIWPFQPRSTPTFSRPSPSVLGVRPMANMICSASSVVPSVRWPTRPASVFSKCVKMWPNENRMPCAA